MSISGTPAANGQLLLRTLHGMLSKQYNAAPGRTAADTAPLPNMPQPAGGQLPAVAGSAAQLSAEQPGLAEAGSGRSSKFGWRSAGSN